VTTEDADDALTWHDRFAARSLRLARRQPLLAALVAGQIGPLVALAFRLGRPLAALPLAAACLIVAWCFAVAGSIRTFATRYEEAFAARDLDAIARLRSLYEGAEPRTPAEEALRHVGDAELMLRLERWDEARAAYARVALEALPPLARPGIVGAHGYAAAQAGDADGGVALLEQAWSEAARIRAYPAHKRWHLRARLGIALSLAARHDEAISCLGPLLDGDEDDDRATILARRALQASCSARALPSNEEEPAP
jgi:tetratricopeptide (TPR) repeat protein